MSIFTKLGADIAAPTDAAGAPRKVVNGEFQTWMTEVERLIQIATGNGDLLLFNSKDDLNSSLNHPANTGALLIGESIADDGLYMKQGASGAGSWVKIGGVPGQGFVKATNTGTGTSTAIEASTPVAVNETQLILLPIAAENAGSPVTVSFNGGSPLTIKTVSGSDVAAGGLPASSVMLGTIQGSTFRLLSDQASAAIQAAAEAARDEAIAAASSVQSKLDSKAFAEDSYHPVSAPDFIETAGYATAGDGGGALYKKVGAEPSHAGKFFIILADGVTVVWYELAENDANPFMFGALSNGSDDKVPVQNCVAYALTKASDGFKTVRGFGRSFAISEPIELGTGIRFTDFKLLALPSAAWTSFNAMLEMTTGYHVMIDHVYFDGNRQAKNAFLNTQEGFVRLTNCRAVRYTEKGYWLAASAELTNCAGQQWTAADPEVLVQADHTAYALYLTDEATDTRIIGGVYAYGASPLYIGYGVHHVALIGTHLYNGLDPSTGPMTNASIAEIYGYRILFNGCYLDLGAINYHLDATNTDVDLEIVGCYSLYDASKSTFASWVVLHTENASQNIYNLYLSETNQWAGNSVDVVSLATSGSGSWVAGLSALFSGVRRGQAAHRFGVVTGVTDPNSFVGHDIRTAHANFALARFRNRTASGIGAEFGIQDDAAVIRINGLKIFDGDANGAGPTVPLELPTYTVAQANALPSIGSGKVIYVSNGASGSPCLAVSAGGTWYRLSSGGAISSS